MAAPQASSRLEMLQARFQQKQLQEKEQKLLQLYDQQQQRAYQVVQRGSAGSNGSNGSVSQHTVTKTSSTHTTTTQGGKVRQMFDERRQTTVKGIDRSYPLEPLENKPRKQTNGNSVAAQKNGNLTVNRQSVTVRRVARSNVNSNLNGGKPVASYHEEITRETYGPSTTRHEDEDEFGNENQGTRYANGDHREEVRMDEIMDQDTIERNRMMAKLHLMDYDETLKHRVKNDLESEEFPEELMVDVPDRLPKRNVTKKLSQAEARLERFKNANAKRNNVLKNATTSVTRKRSEPMFPSKSTSRVSEVVRTRTQEVIDRRSDTREKSAGSIEPRRARRTSESLEETPSSSESEKIAKRPNESPRFFCRESESSATTFAIDSKTAGRLSPESVKNAKRRDVGTRFHCRESGKSATTYQIDPKTMRTLSPEFKKDLRRGSGSHEFFCRETEKSATTFKIDPKTMRTLSPEFKKDLRRGSRSPEFFCRETGKSATTFKIDPKTMKTLSPEFKKDLRRGSGSPEFFCKETEKSATTFNIDSKTIRTLSPEFKKDLRRGSGSPEFFCKETEKSATTFKIDGKTGKALSPEFSRDIKRAHGSSQLARKESDKFDATLKREARTNKSLSLDSGKSGTGRRGANRKFFCRESERSGTTMTTDTVDRELKSSRSEKVTGTFSADAVKRAARDREEITGIKIESISTRNRSPNVFERLTKERSSSPRFPYNESKKPTTMNIDSKSPEIPKKTSVNRIESPRLISHKYEKISRSPDFPGKSFRKSNTSPQFFCTESDRSATTMLVTPETISKFRKGSPEKDREPTSVRSFSKKSYESTTNTHTNRRNSLDRSEERKQTRDSVSRFFYEEFEKSTKRAGGSPRSRSLDLSRDQSPVSLKDMETWSSRTGSPEFHRGLSEKFSSTGIEGSTSRTPSPRSRSVPVNGNKSPEFFCYETEKSATTVSLKPKPSKHSPTERSKFPGSIDHRKIKKIEKQNNDTKDIQVKRSTKSPENTRRSMNFTKDPPRSISGNILRSTKMIREVLDHQSDKREPRHFFRRSDTTDGREISIVSGTKDRMSSRRNTEGNRSRKIETAGLASRIKVDGRASTPTDRAYKPSTPEMSPKSSTSAEVDAEIQEITMPDQYVARGKILPAKRATITRRKNGDTYTRSYKTQITEKSGTGSPLTYSVRKPCKIRESVLGSNIFKPVITVKKIGPKSTSEMKSNRDETIKKIVEKSVNLKEITRNKSNSPSPTNESIFHTSKRRTGEHTVNRQSGNKREISSSRKKTPSPTVSRHRETTANLKETFFGESDRKRDRLKGTSPTGTSISHCSIKRSSESESETLRSMDLVRKAMKGREVGTGKEKPDTMADGCSKENSIRDYERTDSVESALRRFDSIGAESCTASLQYITELNNESVKDTSPRETNRENGRKSFEDLEVVSRKPLDEKEKGIPGTGMKKTSTFKVSGSPAKSRGTIPEFFEGQETRTGKGSSNAGDSTEITRIIVKSKSPPCKRKLFQDTDSRGEREHDGRMSKCSIVSLSTKIERSTSSSPKLKSNKNEISRLTGGSPRLFARYETVKKRKDKPVSNKKSTGTPADSEAGPSVKQLRSIEDIRKSIDNENYSDHSSRISVTTTSESTSVSAIANKSVKRSSQSGNGNRGNGKRRDSCLNAETRFSRVAKSPSPDSVLRKVTETSTRARRSLPSSPSKSPDMVTRRPSTDLRSQDTKSTKRAAAAKGAEPIGNRKTTTTTTTAATTARKSTDVVDGVVHENGLHLRDQTAETKYDNDSPTSRKNDAFVVDFDEQPAKENDAALPRKPLLRKQSGEKQTFSTQSVRPPSSVSSVSSGSSMQGQTSVPRARMAARTRTSISGASPSKGSTSVKGNMNCTESLASCKICGRRFAQDRVTLHEQICSKTVQKKRKQFDTMMYRIRGTDLEPFVKKSLARRPPETKPQKPEVKSNWRRKHEDFINTIRSAKQVQAHLAAGGKLSDLPPPPISDTSDYIQCPHCGRKFNQCAADRHIPKCQNMLHNKPVQSRTPKPRR